MIQIKINMEKLFDFFVKKQKPKIGYARNCTTITIGKITRINITPIRDSHMFNIRLWHKNKTTYFYKCEQYTLIDNILEIYGELENEKFSIHKIKL